MANLNTILTTIKNLSLTAKVGLGMGITAIVAGSAVGIVVIANNTSKTSEISQNVVDDSNDDNSPSEPTNVELEETGEPKDDNKTTEQAVNTTNPATSSSSKPQTTTQKPGSSTSTSTNQSQSSNNSSTSKPSTSTTPATQPTSPSVRPSQPSQPSTSATKPTQPTTPEKKPDYNLNDNYAIAFCGGVVSGQDVSFQVIDKSSDVAMNSCVAKIYNEARKHSEYASMTDEELSSEVLGMGSAGPLDEDMCTRNSLSCGRW